MILKYIHMFFFSYAILYYVVRGTSFYSTTTENMYAINFICIRKSELFFFVFCSSWRRRAEEKERETAKHIRPLKKCNCWIVVCAPVWVRLHCSLFSICSVACPCPGPRPRPGHKTGPASQASQASQAIQAIQASHTQNAFLCCPMFLDPHMFLSSTHICTMLCMHVFSNGAKKNVVKQKKIMCNVYFGLAPTRYIHI